MMPKLDFDSADTRRPQRTGAACLVSVPVARDSAFPFDSEITAVEIDLGHRQASSAHRVEFNTLFLSTTLSLKNIGWKPTSSEKTLRQLVLWIAIILSYVVFYFDLLWTLMTESWSTLSFKPDHSSEDSIWKPYHSNYCWPISRPNETGCLYFEIRLPMGKHETKLKKRQRKSFSWKLLRQR